jgi:Tfp pilus assembly protein PilF
MFMKERKLDAAEQYLRKAIDLNAQNENALALLAKILLSRGKKNDAAIYIDRAVSIRPERPMTQKLRRAIMDS